MQEEVWNLLQFFEDVFCCNSQPDQVLYQLDRKNSREKKEQL